MASITEYQDLSALLVDINDPSRKAITFLNANTNGKYSKSNGYKIFWITIDKDDQYFQPEEYHGDRIYTILSNKIRDCKSVVVPIYSFAVDGISDKDFKYFKEYVMEKEPFNVYVGTGFVNIIVNCNVLDWFFNDKYKFHEGSSIGLILVSDGMYTNRSDALHKLLSLISLDE